MKTNLLILSMYLINIYVKKIVKEIIKSQSINLDLLFVTLYVYPLEATAQLSKIKTLIIFSFLLNLKSILFSSASHLHSADVQYKANRAKHDFDFQSFL
mgnify:CR=1 FL=1